MSECRHYRGDPKQTCTPAILQRPDFEDEDVRRERGSAKCPASGVYFHSSGGCLSMMKHIGFLAFYSQPEAVEREVKNGGGIQR